MKFMRVPIIETLGKSPFEALKDHISLVKKSAALLREVFEDLMKNEFADLEGKKKIIEDLELKADYIKSNIRNHLPKSVKMPVDRGVFLSLLSEIDKVEDLIQDVAEWISIREKPVPDELKQDFIELFTKALEAIEYTEKAVDALNFVIESSFVEKERENAKKIIEKLHIIEHESDLLERRLTKKIFQMEEQLSAAALFHLSKLVFLLGDISNHAENAGDRVRALIAK